MAFEDIKAEIALLFEQMVNQPQDAHEIRETVREKLNALRANGLPLTDDLVELEKRIEKDFDS
jgi:predicted  nucleic acid-binding Zn-ribbon protein